MAHLYRTLHNHPGLGRLGGRRRSVQELHRVEHIHSF
jgi:hypothetical protein